MQTDDHFNQAVEMVRLGSGAFRRVENMRLSRMAELFGVEVPTINYHLSEIYKSGELTESTTIRKIQIVQTEGDREVNRDPYFYNLDAIIAVGYRANSYQATQNRPKRRRSASTTSSA